MEYKKITFVLVCIFLLILILSSCDTFTYIRKGGNHLYLYDDNSELFWFNGIHSNDPNNIMFGHLKNEFLKFKADLVLVEGGYNKNIQPNEQQAILYGESSFVAFLAKEENIECLSIEPDDSYIGKELLKKYTVDDILVMYILRQIKQWQREAKKRSIDFEGMLVGWVKANIKRSFPDNEAEINLFYIQNICEPYIGIKLGDVNWKTLPADRIVYREKNTINSIWKEAISIRNNYLIEFIRDKKKYYKKIFVMMGFDHVRATRSRLEELYQNKE